MKVNITPAQQIALRWLAGERIKPKARRNPLHSSTIGALVRAGLLAWEHTDKHVGHVVSERGRLVLDQLRKAEQEGERG